MKKGLFKRALNPKSGPFRLTLVVSIFIGTLLGRMAGNLSDASYSGWFQFLTSLPSGSTGSIVIYSKQFQLSNFFAVFLGTSFIIWVIYLTIYWIALGFKLQE